MKLALAAVVGAVTIGTLTTSFFAARTVDFRSQTNAWVRPARSSSTSTSIKSSVSYTSPETSYSYEDLSPMGTTSGDPKTDLLDLLSSGVGDGYYVKNRATTKSIKKAIADLEAAGPGDSRREIKFPADFEDLDGRWKLLYSSNILGVGRLSPLTLNDVYQVVDTARNSIKNVVYATLSPPMFVETWGRFPVASIANTARRVHNRVSFKVDFSLDHSFEISSMEYPAQLKIALKETKLLNCEKPDMRSVALPAIRPLAKAGAGKFDTTYLDSDLRVSRGAFGEVRVFTRVSDDEMPRRADKADVTDDYSSWNYSSRIPADDE